MSKFSNSGIKNKCCIQKFKRYALKISNQVLYSKFMPAMSIVEMLIALGIVGSAIFTMLVITAKTGKVAVVNQSRNIATQAASQGIELTIRAYRENLLTGIPNLCSGDEVYIGVIEDAEGNLTVIEDGQGMIRKPIDGNPEENPLLLPMKIGQDGRWTSCSESEAELFRGIGLEKVSDEGNPYISIRSIVYWEIFTQKESVTINTRLPNMCMQE